MTRSCRAMPRASRLAIALALAAPLSTLAADPTSTANAGDTADTAYPAYVYSAAAIADALPLEAVEVHSLAPSRAQTERALTPGAVSIIELESLERRSVGHLADALRYVPGIWTHSSSGSDAIFISSRGSNLDATDYDSNGIKLLQDGLPVTTADGNNHNRFVDPLSASEMVVARGANALTLGAATLGGAIDFVSATARNSAARQLHLQGGSHGMASGRVAIGGVSDALDGLVTVEARGRDGYRVHSRQDRIGFHANGGWQVSDDVELRAFATHIDSDEQLPGALTRAQFEADPNQPNPSAISGNFQLNVVTDRLAATGAWTGATDGRLEFGLSVEDQSLYHPIVDRIMVDFDGDGPNPPVEVFSLLKDTRQRTVGGMLRYNVQRGEHDLLAGIHLAETHETGGNFRNHGGLPAGQTGVIDNRSDSVELYLMDRWTLAADWTLVYGLQGILTGRDVRLTDLGSGELRNPREDYHAINPRLGAIRTLGTSTEAYASLGRLYEAPTTFELEDDVRGDSSALDAMRGTVLELGVRGGSIGSAAAPSWHWDVSAYYARIHDEILSVDDPDAPGTSLSTNVDRTIKAGLEAVVGGSFPVGEGGLRLEPLVSATWNAFSFDDDPVYGDNDLPAAPRYAVRGEVLLRADNGFFVGPTFDLVGARHADFANSYRVESHQLLGLRAGLERGAWMVFGEARNLADEEYVGTFSVRDRALADAAILQPGEPRSVYLGVRYRF